jgi:hypothetical protein
VKRVPRAVWPSTSEAPKQRIRRGGAIFDGYCEKLVTGSRVQRCLTEGQREVKEGIGGRWVACLYQVDGMRYGMRVGENILRGKGNPEVCELHVM